MAVFADQQIEVHADIIDPLVWVYNVNAMCLVSKREYERGNFVLLFSRNAASIEEGWTCGVTRMYLHRWKPLKEEALQQCDSQ